MSKEVDALDLPIAIYKIVTQSICDGYLAGRAAEQERCLTAIGAERIPHDSTNCSVLRPDCEDCRYNQAIDDVLAAIRGSEGEKEKEKEKENE